MSFKLTKNIYSKPPSDPLNSWSFMVKFQFSGYILDYLGKTLPSNVYENISLVPIKIDLPSFETTIVTQKFFGSEKSFPVLRKHSGETSMEFYTHSNPDDDSFILMNFIKTLNTTMNNYNHLEFTTVFDKINIEVYNKTDTLLYNYTLINCIPTKLDIGSFNYESDEIMKYTLGIHYDDWFVDNK